MPYIRRMPHPSLKITAKGQVTLKKAVLDHLGLKPGDALEVRLGPGGKVELAAPPPAHDISAVFGMLTGVKPSARPPAGMDAEIAGYVGRLDDATRADDRKA